MLSGIAEQGIAQSAIRADVDPKKIANLIIGSLEGALIISRLEQSNEALQAAEEHLHAYLESARRRP